MAIEHRLAPISEAELAKKCDNLVAGDDGKEEEDNSNHSRDQIKPKITTREDVNKFISALLTRLQRTSFFVFVLSDIASRASCIRLKSRVIIWDYSAVPKSDP